MTLIDNIKWARQVGSQTVKPNLSVHSYVMFPIEDNITDYLYLQVYL